MKPYYQSKLGRLYHGDCRDILPEISGITAVVTDPPYGLEFMGKEWDHGIPGKRYWELILNSCLPGAIMLAFGGSRTIHRLVCAIEDAGWEIRDRIEYLHWVYGSGFPKSHDISKAIDKAAGVEREEGPVDQNRAGRLVNQRGNYETDAGWSAGNRKITIDPPATDEAKLWEGYGTALKPAHEPICLAMKPIEGTFEYNVLKYGVGGLNIDGGRVEVDKDDVNHREMKNKQVHTTTFANEGIARPDKKREYGSQIGEQGRHPANIIHDGSPEVLSLFPESNSTRIGNQNNPKRGAKHTPSSYGKGNDEETCDHRDEGSAARFFYCAKASKSERGKDNKHPTVKPLELIKYLLTLVTMPEKNLILDPFLGSGTTAMACEEHKLPWIACEKEEESCEIAAKRIDKIIKSQQYFLF